MRREPVEVGSHPVTFGDARGAQGTVTRNASTVSPLSPEEELRTVIKAFPGMGGLSTQHARYRLRVRATRADSSDRAHCAESPAGLELEIPLGEIKVRCGLCLVRREITYGRCAFKE
jgi:hypothetical protein